MSVSVSALVLAGGHSSRMGTDKALLSWQGIPLLKRVCDAAHCCSATFVLTPWPQRYQTVVPHSVQLIPEKSPHQGPLVALLQGFEVISTPWIMLLACDLPCLDSQILQSWIDLLPLHPALAHVPYQKGRWEPLCGFYHQRCRAPLQAFVDKGGRSFQEWLSEMNVQKLGVDDAIAATLHNCNTPADMADL